MDALLRELREGPDGIAEYYDTEIQSKELTIGSSPDQNIQLLAGDFGVVILGDAVRAFAKLS